MTQTADGCRFQPLRRCASHEKRLSATSRKKLASPRPRRNVLNRVAFSCGAGRLRETMVTVRIGSATRGSKEKADGRDTRDPDLRTMPEERHLHRAGLRHPA